MSEYISREAAKTITERLRDKCGNDEMAFALNWASRLIRDTPAADVVEVVRCYECIYWEHRPDRQYDLCAYLFGAKHSCTPEDFCSRGKRKGGQDDG